MKVLAIDPGSTHSAYMIIDTDLRPYAFDKLPNHELLPYLHRPISHVVIEQIGHYGTGMPAGQDVFDTCIWIGRFWQGSPDTDTVTLVLRKTVAAHLCGTAKAGDPHIKQALIDRFAPDERNHGKGLKGSPGWFYGFHTDIWAAYALAVYWMDTHHEHRIPDFSNWNISQHVPPLDEQAPNSPDDWEPPPCKHGAPPIIEQQFDWNYGTHMGKMPTYKTLTYDCPTPMECCREQYDLAHMEDPS